jgi:cyanate permease
MLCYGYLMAATGSFVVSILRSLLGGFLPGFLLLASLCFAAAIIAGRVVGSHAETVAA